MILSIKQQQQITIQMLMASAVLVWTLSTWQSSAALDRSYTTLPLTNKLNKFIKL